MYIGISGHNHKDRGEAAKPGGPSGPGNPKAPEKTIVQCVISAGEGPVKVRFKETLTDTFIPFLRRLDEVYFTVNL